MLRFQRATRALISAPFPISPRTFQNPKPYLSAGHKTLKPYPSRIHTRRMAAQASIETYVKGDPEASVLGDCPFCHRVLLTLEEKKLPYEKSYIDFANKPAWLFEVNESGTVPIIKDGEKWVPDSGAIVEYLEEKYPEPAVPSDEEGMGAITGIFKSFKGLLLNKDDSEAGEKEAALLAELQKVEDLLSKNGGPFLGGENLNAVDCALLPRLYHMATTLGHFKGWSVPDSLPKVQEYMEKAAERDSWKNTDYGKEMIIKGWSKHFE